VVSDACRLPPRFDQEAAREAADQLMITVQSLLGVLAALEQDKTTVADGWTGPFRTEFDKDMSRLVTGGGLLTETLRQMAVVIRAKAYEAEAAERAAVEG
jgi:uncharacterized protein YukE